MEKEFVLSHKDNMLVKEISKIKLPVILFGAAINESAVEFLEKNNIKILGFCDNDVQKHGKIYNGYRIFNFEEVKDKYNDEQICVIITANAGAEEILLQINKDGWYSNIKQLDLTGLEVEDWYKYYNIHINELENVYSMLEDEKSRDVFKNVIDYRICREKEKIEKIYDDEKGQYFDEKIVNLKCEGSFVDVGAYDGDTVLGLEERVQSFEKIICFEPNRNNYDKLYNNYKNNIKVQMFNVGVYDTTTQLQFSNIGGKQAKVEEDGVEKISVVDLDSFLCKENIKFIKMDIEGSEQKALMGAKEILKRMKPTLAICVYHNKDDIFRIPQMLKEIVPEYKLYFRHYSKSTCDTICYAVI